jgi:penicillin amidase
VAYGSERYGADIDRWQWGRVRPFVLAHAFAAEGGFLGTFFNTRPLSLGGDTETAFKQQFPRSDREHMRSAIGPLVRLTVDLGDPWGATFSMAGGESGWPASPWYANLVDDWSQGIGRPLTPEPSADDVNVAFIPLR